MALQRGTLIYITIEALMIIFFTYFWVATQFNEIQIADDLKKYGGYIPGVRPGQATSDFLHRAMSRITLAGALFLAAIAIVPTLMYNWWGVPLRWGSFLAAPACSSRWACCWIPCGRWSRIC